MGSSFFNSLFISIPATLIPLLVGALAAFAFSWIRFPFRDTIFLTIVALMVVPIQMSLVPMLKLFQSIGENVFGDRTLITGSFVGHLAGARRLRLTVLHLPACATSSSRCRAT